MHRIPRIWWHSLPIVVTSPLRQLIRLWTRVVPCRLAVSSRVASAWLIISNSRRLKPCICTRVFGRMSPAFGQLLVKLWLKSPSRSKGISWANNTLTSCKSCKSWPYSTTQPLIILFDRSTVDGSGIKLPDLDGMLLGNSDPFGSAVLDTAFIDAYSREANW